MGRVGKNVTMKGVTGRVGNVVFRNSRTGVVAQNVPTRRKKSTPRQADQNNLFKEATIYANLVKARADLVTFYAPGIRSNAGSVYHVALTDYLNSPKIVYIKTEKYTGRPGDIILIKATDDFKVVGVTVQIKDARGKLIERGSALPYPRRPKLWRYFAVAENIKPKRCLITVAAEDKPGNRTEASVTWPVDQAEE